MKRTSITLEDAIYEKGLENAKKRGYGFSFSAYLAWLIARDAEGGVSREAVTPEPAKKSHAPVLTAASNPNLYIPSAAEQAAQRSNDSLHKPGPKPKSTRRGIKRTVAKDRARS